MEATPRRRAIDGLQRDVEYVVVCLSVVGHRHVIDVLHATHIDDSPGNLLEFYSLFVVIFARADFRTITSCVG